MWIENEPPMDSWQAVPGHQTLVDRHPEPGTTTRKTSVTQVPGRCLWSHGWNAVEPEGIKINCSAFQTSWVTLDYIWKPKRPPEESDYQKWIGGLMFPMNLSSKPGSRLTVHWSKIQAGKLWLRLSPEDRDPYGFSFSSLDLCCKHMVKPSCGQQLFSRGFTIH